MPVRSYTRSQMRLVPQTWEDLLPDDHLARFVALFVDNLRDAEWWALGVKPNGEPVGAPRYHPKLLLAVWTYAFLSRMRRSRAVEQACRDSIPIIWLAGGETPDHNTLWRFFKNREKTMRVLFRKSVATAYTMKLLDLATQALDGTKIAANASRERFRDRATLERLLEAVEREIDQLVQENEDDAAGKPLTGALGAAESLRERLQEAMAHLQESGLERVNLTDPDAQLMQGRQGYLAGYNAQAMVVKLNEAEAGRPGLFVTAAEVTTEPADQGQLALMLDAAREEVGEVAGVTVADAGYHSGANLEAAEAREMTVLMPEAHRKHVLESPFHKDRFIYDEAADTYRCPEGQTLRYAIQKRRREGVRRVYRAGPVCGGCPFFGACTKNEKRGREIEIGVHDRALRTQRALMRETTALARYALRQGMVEPVFGILKAVHGFRQFWARGLPAVRSAWLMMAFTLNMKSLYEVWRLRGAPQTWTFAEAA